MKKIILGVATLLLLTGCGMTDEEKEKMFYNSLEKAYIATYVSDGAGLAVYPIETENPIEINGENWFHVAITGYDKISDLSSKAEDVYTKKIADEMVKIIKEKYQETDTGLYTKSEGGCRLPYLLDEDTIDQIKADVKITKIKSSKIIFEYKGKEFTAKKSDNNYVFDEKIFECGKSAE